MVFLAAALVACPRSHERGAPGVDAALGPDAAPTADATTRDATIDVGTSSSCEEYWLALPWCPADARAAIGQPCDSEGRSCGTDCCEPGPAISCLGGRWTEITVEPDCSDVRCAAPRPCGDGRCRHGATCIVLDGESRAPARCVVGDVVLTSCSDAPPTALGSDPHDCIVCGCLEAPSGIDVSIECTCC